MAIGGVDANETKTLKKKDEARKSKNLTERVHSNQSQQEENVSSEEKSADENLDAEYIPPPQIKRIIDSEAGTSLGRVRSLSHSLPHSIQDGAKNLWQQIGLVQISTRKFETNS